MKSDIALLAHLLRRAGFGANRAELEEYTSRGYEAVVDSLLHPERSPEVDDDVIGRYNLGVVLQASFAGEAERWFYRMINTKRPLQEKIALFWHHVFATAWYKTEHNPDLVRQIEMFREIGLSDLRTILTRLSRDPAMLDWLDNQENHKDEPNENYARELLELFSMGVGNYSEDDIKNAALAFTGWSFVQPIPGYPYGQYPSEFAYLDEEHDDSEKTFLGETGRFNGEDIIDIIVRQPATAEFISRHLYNFFVADEPQVPSWNQVPPQDPDAIKTLVDTYFKTGGDIRAVLGALFRSDFFKEATFRRVKCPAEFIAGTVKIVDTDHFPSPGLARLPAASTMMGQELLNPPTVEGWHTGKEWIDGGTLAVRVDFAVQEVSDSSSPGVRAIAERLGAQGRSVSPEEFVDICLDLIGPLEVGGETHAALLKHAREAGPLTFENGIDPEIVSTRVVRLLQLIVSAREYQFA
ncbi:MAG: DUF1800 domain-containing protein [Chloroflexi bacterium]|nr:DUF1800 domain-containing protein [Chloroflexota bacterium]